MAYRIRQFFGIILLSERTVNMFAQREFDFCLSLGGSCAGALQLSLRDLRLVAMPFDWVRSRDGIRYVDTVGTLLETKFSGWCAFEHLMPMPEDLDHPKATDPLEVRVWDKVQDIGFFHDFRFNIFGRGGRAYYDAVMERYNRRIARLYNAMSRSRRVLAVVVGAETTIPFADICRLRERLGVIWPDTSFTVVDINFMAPSDTTEGGLEEGVFVRNVRRRMHPYDFTRTSWEWDFLDGTRISGMVSLGKEPKRNATKGMSLLYRLHRKVFLYSKKVLERMNAQ